MTHALQVWTFAPEDVRQAMFRFANTPTQAPVALTLVVQWLAQALKRKKGDRCLCISCDAQFNGKRPSSHEWSVVVVEPFAQGEQAITSGMCPKCAAKPDCANRLVASLRAIIPDAHIIQSGTG